jgi:hypothetical protein
MHHPDLWPDIVFDKHLSEKINLAPIEVAPDPA